MRLKPGDRIGEYKILEVIGNGGFSIIYRAEDTFLLRQVAIKQLSTEVFSEEGTREWFIREARLAASLNHPNIVGTYALREEGDSMFLIMEYLPGGDLHDLMSQQGPLDLTTILRIATDICHALQALHDREVIHRDIKPENILIGPEEQFKLADFRLAHIRQAQYDDDTGPQPGTLLYMSPEQALGRKITVRSDIYSLAVVLYELMTGHYYLDCDLDDFDDEELTALIADALPIEPDTHHPSVPPELGQLLLRALEKDAHARPASAREFLAEIRSVVARSKRRNRAQTGQDESHEEELEPSLAQDIAAIRELRDVTQAPEAAQHQLEVLLERHPDSPEVLAEWGETLLALGHFDDACIALEQATQQSPNLPYAQLALSELYRSMEDTSEEADSALILAIQSDPDLVYSVLIEDLINSTSHPEAFITYVELFRRAADESPSAATYHVLGQVLALDDLYTDDCLAAFETAIERDPDYGPAYVGLGRLLIDMNRAPEALHFLEQATYLYFPTRYSDAPHPKLLIYQRAHAFLALAFAYAQTGRMNNSAIAANTALESSPEEVEPHLPSLLEIYTSTAESWIVEGEVTRAHKLLTEAVPLAARWGDYQTFLLLSETQGIIGAEFRRSQQWDNAIEWLKASLESLRNVSPDIPDAQQLSAHAHEELRRAQSRSVD